MLLLPGILRFGNVFILWIIFALPLGNHYPAQYEDISTGNLTKNQRIFSQKLNYNLQYRVYTPTVQNRRPLPVIYVTDGQWYLSQGNIINILDKLITEKSIEPVMLVFIDNRDPDNLTVNRRNSQLLCNENFLHFVTDELIVTIESKYQVIKHASGRAIMGMSFGGLNAAYFGLHGWNTFGMVAMQSPALHPCPDIYQQFKAKEKLPLKIFLSTGKENDTEKGTRELHSILASKGYEMQYLEVDGSHNWNNWRPLIDDILLYFFPA